MFAQTYKLAVVRLYFLQDSNPPIDLRWDTTSTQAMPRFDVSYQRPDNTWVIMPGGQISNNRAVVRVSFSDLTDAKAIRVKVLAGASDGYSKIVELR